MAAMKGKIKEEGKMTPLSEIRQCKVRKACLEIVLLLSTFVTRKGRVWGM